MPIDFRLLQDLIPLYLLIGIGFWLGQTFQLAARPIAVLLIYSITPAVVFSAVFKVQTGPQPWIMVGCTLICAALLCLSCLPFSTRQQGQSTGRLMALALGTGNTGYFGIPVCAMLFSAEGAALAVFSALGQTLYENTLGYFVLCRNSMRAKEALLRVLRLPAVHAVLLALILKTLNLNSPAPLKSTLSFLEGAYAPCGMMLIGLALSEYKPWKNRSDLKFALGLSILKPVLWMVCMTLLLILEQRFFHVLSDLNRQVLFIQSAVPIAANTVAFAQETGVQPGKASFAVAIATLTGLVFMPLAQSLQPF